MKKIILLIALALTTASFAQDKLITKTGKIYFESLYLKAFQDVKAENTGVTSVLNTKTGEIAFLALIKGFRFEVALMEEHFNENYMESVKYPKSTFKGKIENFDVKALTNADKDYKITGIIELHGKQKEITVNAKIKKNYTNGIEIRSNFFLATDDFSIPVPAIVKNKVSSKMSVKTEIIFY